MNVDSEMLVGLKAVKGFLFRCSKGSEVEEAEAEANRKILKEYLEMQTKEARKNGEDAEKEVSAFAEVVQIWSYANQVYWNSLVRGEKLTDMTLTARRIIPSTCCRWSRAPWRTSCGYVRTTKRSSRATERSLSRVCYSRRC